jgi:hypothetical protein
MCTFFISLCLIVINFLYIDLFRYKQFDLFDAKMKCLELVGGESEMIPYNRLVKPNEESILEMRLLLPNITGNETYKNDYYRW